MSRPAFKIERNDADLLDRPGWIPEDILYDWDTNPYAYQTEEELMPGGGPHGQILGYILEVLRVFLMEQDKMLLMDSFMLYRDKNGVKQRVAPDLIRMPFCDPPLAYDLDIEPPPQFVADVTSMKNHLEDLKKNVRFYAELGIQSYLIIDSVISGDQIRDQLDLYLWRNSDGRIFQQTEPDEDGYLSLLEIGCRVRARGRKLIFAESRTGEIIRDTSDLTKWAKEAEKEREQERKRTQSAEKRAEAAEKKAEQAQQNVTKKLARKMLHRGYDIAEISEITGLGTEEILALKVLK